MTNPDDHPRWSDLDLSGFYDPSRCECPVCNPCIHPENLVGMVCATTGVGFIGPLPEVLAAQGSRILGDPMTHAHIFQFLKED